MNDEAVYRTAPATPGLLIMTLQDRVRVTLRAWLGGDVTKQVGGGIRGGTSKVLTIGGGTRCWYKMQYELGGGTR